MLDHRDPEAGWEAAFGAYHARFAPAFARAEVRARTQRYLHGLLAPVERKNGWQLAEAIGEDDPQGVQRLLYEAVWDADGVRDTYQQFVIEQFGDPHAILVLDETGFLKKGRHSVGVQRQYSGTAGKVENCQLGVFLAYVTPRGHVLLDRRLYLPQPWAHDPARRAAAHVPEAVVFQTIPELGVAMLEHAIAQRVPFGWVTADEGYGKDPKLLARLEQRAIPYVIAVARTTPVWRQRPAMQTGPRGGQHLAADAPPLSTAAAVVANLSPTDWQRLSVGAGAKGPRVSDWAAVRVVACRAQQPGPDLWLLARRSVRTPTEVAYYLAHAPADTPLAVLARVAGARWPVEQCFEEAKGETGLDQYEVRTWPSWHRHITLVMLAHGFLAWLRQEAGKKSGAVGRPGGAERGGIAATADDHAAPPVPVGGVPAGVVALAPPPAGTRPLRPLSRRPPPLQAARSYLRL